MLIIRNMRPIQAWIDLKRVEHIAEKAGGDEVGDRDEPQPVREKSERRANGRQPGEPVFDEFQFAAAIDPVGFRHWRFMDGISHHGTLAP